ncbi:MAG TPA: hypothetical protein VIR65_09260 [Rhizorhapis sp.]
MQSAEMKVNVIASSFLLAVLAFVGAPVIAQDASGVQSVVSVEGWVPVICQASAPDLHPEEGISGTVRFVGTLEEICNGGSYQVWLEHAAGIQGLAVVDNAPVMLDPSGRTLISQSAHPDRRKRNLILQFDGSAAAPQAVTMRMQPGL